MKTVTDTDNSGLIARGKAGWRAVEEGEAGWIGTWDRRGLQLGRWGCFVELPTGNPRGFANVLPPYIRLKNSCGVVKCNIRNVVTSL